MAGGPGFVRVCSGVFVVFASVCSPLFFLALAVPVSLLSLTAAHYGRR